MEGYVISIMIIVVICGAFALYDNMKVTTEDRIRERVSYLRFVFEDILSGASAVVSEVEKRMGE